MEQNQRRMFGKQRQCECEEGMQGGVGRDGQMEYVVGWNIDQSTNDTWQFARRNINQTSNDMCRCLRGFKHMMRLIDAGASQASQR
jgi:hypothetical protein